MARSGRFAIIKDFNSSAIQWELANEMNSTLKNFTNRFNHRVPGILRQALITSIASHPGTKPFVSSIRHIRSDNRPIKNPKVGQSLSIKVNREGGYARIILSKKALGPDPYYRLIFAQYGHGPIYAKGKKPMPVPVKDPNRAAQKGGAPIPHWDVDGAYVRFVWQIDSMNPYHKWVDKAIVIAKQRILDLIEELS